MSRFLLCILLAATAFSVPFKGTAQAARDTSEVKTLNSQALLMRLTNPDQTIKEAARALALAQKLNYVPGIAESYRVMGLAYYYSNNPIKAIGSYLTALNNYTKIRNLRGEGKVYNNIGSLYRLDDYDRALEFFNKALAIALKIHDKALLAPVYLNLGDVYFREKIFNQALIYDDKSSVLYAELKDSLSLVLCLQNKGAIYLNLKQFDKAEGLLLEANQGAKKLDLNETIGSIDLSLAELYIDQSKYADAERAVNEGMAFSVLVKDDKMERDYKYTSYQLERKRKNFQNALSFLYDIYHQDSTSFKQNTSAQLNLIREEVKQQARQKENELLLQRQQYDRVKFWAVALVAGLLLFLVAVLINNVKRKAKTNIQLTNLNEEVSRQKDNLDRINHHLEEIIDERTKDLQIKNKKLSEYSSYLSHQIRGPIATLKGLLNLEREGLVDEPECIRMMNKSVSAIDDKIIEMSDMLHDPGRTGF